MERLFFWKKLIILSFFQPTPRDVRQMADYNLWKRDQMHSQKHRFIKTPYGYGYYTSGLEAYDQLDNKAE